MKWQRSIYQPCLPLGDNHSRITGCERHIKLSRKAACEGIVLLKNDNGLLPLKRGQRVAIFGKAQIDYVKCGGGSGDVMVAYVRNIYEGLQMKRNKVEIYDELSLFYQNYVNRQYKDPKLLKSLGQVESEELSYKECPLNGKLKEPCIPKNLLENAASFTDTAIITLNRYSEETADHRNDGTDKYVILSETEQKMVDDVCTHFSHVIVLFNVGTMIDTSWMEKRKEIEAVLMLWQGGMEGGLATADILVGDENPSGKLVDTYARTFEDYPSSEEFHESDEYAKYTEDIFVGYRYFETIPGKKDRVIYPFGYGLSYTTFEISNIAACDNGKKIFVSADVTNTGEYAGKEVLQLYYEAPVGKITKPTRELCAFIKTEIIEPGDTHSVILSYNLEDMASYDDMGDVEQSAYVMEKGCYKLHLGNSIRNTICLDYHYELKENKIVKKLQPRCVPMRLGKRLQADGTYREVCDISVEQEVFPCTYHCEYCEAEKPKMLMDVVEGNLTLDEFMTQLTDEELLDLVKGQENTGIAHAGGMGNNKRLGIPNVMTGGAPTGVRILPEKKVHTTGFPVGTALACTWNIQLVEEIGKAGALEAKENNMAVWLTPAMNIHRSPLCGRNYEYYSEDPFITGQMATAIVKGVQKQKIVAVPKHLACNNKETNRLESDSIVSERALREIYLKGFEICVKESAPKMIMTSYNLINGVRTSESAELLTGILRHEWGYRGMFTTDWVNSAEHYKEIKAGNDIRMPICDISNLKKALYEGLITRDEIAICAKRILEMILWVD